MSRITESDKSRFLVMKIIYIFYLSIFLVLITAGWMRCGMTWMLPTTTGLVVSSVRRWKFDLVCVVNKRFFCHNSGCLGLLGIIYHYNNCKIIDDNPGVCQRVINWLKATVTKVGEKYSKWVVVVGEMPKKKRQHESNKAKNSAKVATTLRTSVYDSRTEELENAC